MDSDPATRNVLGVIAQNPELARDGIELRKFGLQIIEGLAQERVHNSWIVPGGVGAPLSAATRERILSELPAAKAIAERTIHFFKGALDSYKEEIDSSAPCPPCMLDWSMPRATCNFTMAICAFAAPLAKLSKTRSPRRLRDMDRRNQPAGILSESSVFKPQGFPAGVYRVGPLARLNVADRCGSPAIRRRAQGIPPAFRSPAHSHSCSTMRD